MVLQSQSAPRLEINKESSKIYANSKIKILNPYSDEYDTVSMKCSIVLSIEFELLNDTTLGGKINEMNVTVDDMEVYFMTELTTATMNSQVKALANPLMLLINS